MTPPPATGTAAGPARRPLREALTATGYIALREIRIVLRQPAAFIPGLLIPTAFFFLLVGSLQGFAEGSGLSNYKAFQLPTSILFSAASGGAGISMVEDIERGYFDKLLLTPTNRLALLIGAMGADFARVMFYGLCLTLIALATGTHIATGVAGALAMAIVAGVFGLAYSGFGFYVALRTGSSQATQGASIIIFPLMFVTTSFAPAESLTGWLRTAATYNPVTYLLRGLRAFSLGGWEAGEIGIGVAAAFGMAAVTLTLAVRALRRRVARG